MDFGSLGVTTKTQSKVVKKTIGKVVEEKKNTLNLGSLFTNSDPIESVDKTKVVFQFCDRDKTEKTFYKGITKYKKKVLTCADCGFTVPLVERRI